MIELLAAILGTYRHFARRRQRATRRSFGFLQQSQLDESRLGAPFPPPRSTRRPALECALKLHDLSLLRVLLVLLCHQVNAREISFTYDVLSRPIEKRVDGIRVRSWLWEDNLRLAAELDVSHDLLTRFVYAGRANVPSHMIQGTKTFRLILDPLGSVRLVLNAQSGEIAQRLDYDEWGRITRDTNPGFQPFGFAGGFYNPDLTLVRFGAREYDAITARWIRKDPLGFFGPEGNLYVYASNDPINLTDAAGRSPSRARLAFPPWVDRGNDRTQPRTYHLTPGLSITLTGQQIDQIRDAAIDEAVAARLRELRLKDCSLTAQELAKAAREERDQARKFIYAISDARIVAHQYLPPLIVQGGTLEGLDSDRYGSVKR